MTPIKDLEVGQIYAHIRGSNVRWVILGKEAHVGGFIVEYTTIDSNGVWQGEVSKTAIEDPDYMWPVELDMYLISEEEDVPPQRSS